MPQPPRESTIDTVLIEERQFLPPATFSHAAHVGDGGSYLALWERSQTDPVAFWEDSAKTVHWFRKWTSAFEWSEPFAKWFVGATTNAAFNCLDRHLTLHGSKLAIVWEGEDGKVVTLTFQQLHDQVCKLANAMEQELKLKPGDSAAIYMPMVPEAVIAMLACARVGVTHSVIFAGFAASAVRDRVNDLGCKVIFTADIGHRRGQVLELNKIVNEAIAQTPTVEKVVLLRRRGHGLLGGSKTVLGPKDLDWKQLCDKRPATHQAKELDAEHPLFVLYTSGTTGKPKGIVHSTGGYLVGVNLTAKWVFDLKFTDVYWCTADIGWITGHSYVVYGILGNATTLVLYEGALNHPQPNRIWEIIEKHKVTILYTAPTAIRSFMQAGDAVPKAHKLDSLRLLGTVGEPINPEAWMWYYKTIGSGKLPIVDTWWQTETGAIMISPVPGVTPTKPGSATRPFPGIVADIVDESGNSVGLNEGGYLVIRHPWPSMLRTIHNNPDRYREAYWSRFPGMYFTGDGAHRDGDGYYWIKGRIDDVLNVSGHRLGTMEIESALVSHPAVAEAAVVGKPDKLKGQAIVAFVIPRQNDEKRPLAELRKELKEHVAHVIGALARPDDIRFTKSLPKTRSGKIMRRLLKDLAAGKAISGDTTTLENPGLVELME